MLRAPAALSPAGVTLLALTLVGAALRFVTLDVQSLWFDESFTIIQLRSGLGEFLDGMVLYQATAPLYYLLAWPWERAFGDGAVAMRSLSAAFGTLTVPVAFLAARTMFSTRAGLLAAALVATSPTLVWYSQEVRPYALLVLLSSTTLLFWARARSTGARRDVAMFAASSALAVLTHYFAAFLVGPAALMLLWRRRDAAALLAVAAVAVTGLAMLPLALAQRARGGGSYIGATPLDDRVADIARQFVAGLTLAPGRGLGLLAGLFMIAGLVSLVVLEQGQPRRAGLLAIALVACAVGIPVIMGIAGENFLLLRNVLAGWVPLALAAAGGFAAPGARRVGPVAGGALALTFAAITIAVAATPSYHRSDWRDLSRILETRPASRAIVVQPGWSTPAIGIYLPASFYARGSRSVEVSEVTVLGPDAPSPAVAAGAQAVISRLHLGSGSVALGPTAQVRDLKLATLVLDPPRALTARQIVAAGLARDPGEVLFESR